MDYTQTIIGFLSSALIGGITVAVIQHVLDKKKEIELNSNKLMEEKYRSLLVFMACALDIEKVRYFNIYEE